MGRNPPAGIPNDQALVERTFADLLNGHVVRFANAPIPIPLSKRLVVSKRHP